MSKSERCVEFEYRGSKVNTMKVDFGAYPVQRNQKSSRNTKQ